MDNEPRSRRKLVAYAIVAVVTAVVTAGISGNCLHCHGSVLPLYRRLERAAIPQATDAEQIQKGLQLVSDMDYWDAHKELEKSSKDGKAHPVSCVDCHDPGTMELRVTRPGFLTGIAKLAASDAAAPHLPSIDRWRRGDRKRAYDPNVDGTRQEMRSFVCGQCHVEYYCGKGMTLFFPWNEGLKVEQIEHYYEGLQVHGQRFKDWTHAGTEMEVLKAQHPEFELWSQGIHARSGVACADCHMPYQREGSVKISLSTCPSRRMTTRWPTNEASNTEPTIRSIEGT
jgi:nitrite reductase (cytochrome c-552)